MAFDPPDPVDVSETEDPDENGGKDRSDGEGDGGLPDAPTTLRLCTIGDSSLSCCCCWEEAKTTEASEHVREREWWWPTWMPKKVNKCQNVNK